MKLGALPPADLRAQSGEGDVREDQDNHPDPNKFAKDFHAPFIRQESVKSMAKKISRNLFLRRPIQVPAYENRLFYKFRLLAA